MVRGFGCAFLFILPALLLSFLGFYIGCVGDCMFDLFCFHFASEKCVVKIRQSRAGC